MNCNAEGGKGSTVDLEKLLAGMTLEEKLGQMHDTVFSTLNNSLKAEITGLGGFDAAERLNLNFVGGSHGRCNAQTAISVQKKHLENDRNKIPILFMRDVIHGHTTIFPIPLGMGCSFNPAMLEECSAMTAKECSVVGLHLTYNPMVDHVNDARWGRVMESYGEDPYLSGIMGAAVVRGFQGDDLKSPDSIGTCVKHFAAYGAAEAGRDYNSAEISEYSLREQHLPSYKACLDAGAVMVMSSFNVVNGIPLNGNSHLMLDVLRDEWGFDGVVISDSDAIKTLITHGYTATEKEAALVSIENGCDMEMCSYTYNDYAKELIDEGLLTMEQIDASVMRILKLKEALGLFENPYHGADPERQDDVLLCAEHREVARRAAESAAVLLKNEGVLPFDESVKKIAIVGPFADDHVINGSWACDGKAEDTVSVYQGISALLPDASITVTPGCTNLLGDTDASGIEAAVAAAREADAVIICVGEHESYSGESKSRAELTLPGVQEELIRRVCDANKNSAVLLFNGRPIVLNEVNRVAPAILEMWFPGSEGGNAAARLLFGKVNPSGKLCMSFPKAVGQCPLYYNHPNTGHPAGDCEDKHVLWASNYVDCGNLPLFSFGYGLSYASFEYRGMRISADTMAKGESIKVEVTLANTGKVEGREIVQLYMKDHFGSTVRPVQQLIDFAEVTLAPGEETTVSFTVDEKKLVMWTAKGRFDTEAGLFSLYTGYADHLLFEKQFNFTK